MENLTPEEIKQKTMAEIEKQSPSKPVSIKIETSYDGSELIVNETVPQCVANEVTTALIGWKNRFKLEPEIVIEFLEKQGKLK